MNRREFLAATGAAVGAGLAGCLGPNRPSVGDAVSVSKGKTALLDARVTEQLVTVDNGMYGIEVAEEGQFIVFSFRSGSLRSLNQAEAQEYLAERLDLKLSPDTVAEQGSGRPRFEAENKPGKAGIPFIVGKPFQRVDDAQLRWTGGKDIVWPVAEVLSDDADYLANPPEFTDVNVSFPENSVSGQAAEVTVEARNVGSTAGKFQFITGRSGTSQRDWYGFEIEEQSTNSLTVRIPLADSAEETTLMVDWGYNSEQKTLEQV